MLKRDITTDIARCLVDSQFPLWSHLPIRSVDLDGWDNTTFRLGDDMSVRLPSHEMYVPQIEKEHQWLPILAKGLPLPIPRPLAKGEPGCSFPRPWSVYGWLPGTPATRDQIGDLEAFAADLADFLTALYAVTPSGGPPAGDHSFRRGGPVQVWDHETRLAVGAMADVIDARRVLDVWETAVASEWTREPVWVDGDVAPSNLLASEGTLCGVLDFGCCAVGDPACDLTIAWTLFRGRSREAFMDRLRLDDATWARARGWALWKAASSHVQARRSGEATEAAGVRFGWSGSPKSIIEELLTDCRANG
jgi:aminoglycoside phosphotransferase (APT) family kinase protein